VSERVFFYGTLMAGFDRRRRAEIDDKLAYVGRGSIKAALFDLGIYPAAVPATEGRVWGEVYEVRDAPTVLAALDEIEGYTPESRSRSRTAPNRPPGSISTTPRSARRSGSPRETISSTSGSDKRERTACSLAVRIRSPLRRPLAEYLSVRAPVR
jgi:gamma-glutamylcyclotransferase (GGCT)/AIG2-like uncharacterized protein YtfP